MYRLLIALLVATVGAALAPAAIHLIGHPMDPFPWLVGAATGAAASYFVTALLHRNNPPPKGPR